MRYTVTREDGRVLTLERDDGRPPGYTVTDPGHPGVVTEVRSGRDVLGLAFELADDARAGLLAATNHGGA